MKRASIFLIMLLLLTAMALAQNSSCVDTDGGDNSRNIFLKGVVTAPNINSSQADECRTANAVREWYWYNTAPYSTGASTFTCAATSQNITCSSGYACSDGACRASPLQVCGDGQCQVSEICSTCPADCGVCPSPDELSVYAQTLTTQLNQSTGLPYYSSYTQLSVRIEANPTGTNQNFTLSLEGVGALDTRQYTYKRLIYGSSVGSGNVFTVTRAYTLKPRDHYTFRLYYEWKGSKTLMDTLEFETVATTDIFCRNNQCDAGETCSSCAADCGACAPVNPINVSTPNPTPTPVCGDKVCQSPETCSSCSADCNQCPVLNATRSNSSNLSTTPPYSALPPGPSCYDSDGGENSRNIYVKGTAMYIAPDNISFSWRYDTCIDDYYIEEWHWENSKPLLTRRSVTGPLGDRISYFYNETCVVRSDVLSCGDGYICYDNACIPVVAGLCGNGICQGPETCDSCPQDCPCHSWDCQDSDAGFDIYHQGIVTGAANSFISDYCYHDNRGLYEYECGADNKVHLHNRLLFLCPYACFNGACLNTSDNTSAASVPDGRGLCSDTDGGQFSWNLKVKGKVTGSKPLPNYGFLNEDRCLSSTLLEEYYWYNDQVKADGTYRCSSDHKLFSCESGTVCSDGACIPAVAGLCGNGVCQDSETCESCAVDCGECAVQEVPNVTTMTSTGNVSITTNNATNITQEPLFVSECGNAILEQSEQCDDGCSDTCQIERCTITSARWSINLTTEGSNVSVLLQGKNCQGQAASVEIFEEDFLQDDRLKVQPAAAFFQGDTAITTWIAAWECDGEVAGVCLLGNPEYYFKAWLSPSVNYTTSDLLTTTRLSPLCGDGIIQDGEQCDEGNATGFGLCSSSCALTACGDGLIQTPNGKGVAEVCELGETKDCISPQGLLGISSCNDCTEYSECLATEFCGDGVCTENCIACPQDCGSCPLPSCLDSDGGIDLFVPGTVAGSNLSMLSDACTTITLDNHSLAYGVAEHYCDGGTAQEVKRECPFGLACVDGACTLERCLPQWACADRTTKGFQDEKCQWGTITPCNSGVDCFHGVCNMTQQYCSDSDGNDYFSKGRVQTESITLEDSCNTVDGSTPLIPSHSAWAIKEAFCTGKDASLEYYTCPEGCYNGACVGKASLNLTCGDGLVQDYFGEECDDGNKLSNDGCSSQCVIEVPPCLFSSVWWSTTSVNARNPIKMTVSGQYCHDQQVNFTIYETKLGPDAVVDSLLLHFSGTQASGEWTTPWTCDEAIGCSSPEFYFIAELVGSDKSVQSALLTVQPPVELCTDTDGGRNYALRGVVQQGTKNLSDYCQGAMLQEFDCGEAGGILPLENCSHPGMGSCAVICPFGCQDGACIVNPPTIPNVSTLPSTVSPVCGDNVCQNQENCSLCAEDCGECAVEEVPNATTRDNITQNIPTVTREPLSIGKCGNAVQEQGEQCDDGNLEDRDGCDSACTLEQCGNGKVQAGEQCEGSLSLTCSSYHNKYNEGMVSCDACQFNTSSCYTCTDVDGDAIPEHAESCPQGRDQCPYTTPEYLATLSGDELEKLKPIQGEEIEISSTSGKGLQHYNLTIDGTEARITFKKKVQLVRINQSGCFEKLHFDAPQMVRVEPFLVFLNDSYVADFDQTAEITFFNVTNISVPKILRDGKDCPQCVIKEYDPHTGVLVVEVSGFSEYRVVEGKQDQPSSAEPEFPETTASNSAGSGGGSGGGGSGGQLAEEQVSMENRRQKVPADMHVLLQPSQGHKEVTVQEGLSFLQYRFEIVEYTPRISIVTNTLAERPDFVPEPKHLVYEYVAVITEGFAERDMENIELQFKVPREWLRAHALAEQEVVLLRYEREWEELPTFFSSQDEKYVYYDARLPAFSIFAIAALQKKDEFQQQTVAGSESKVDEVLPKFSLKWIMGLAVLLIIVAGWLWRRR